MCLMCEWYLDICDDEECFNAALSRDEQFVSRSGRKSFLHQGSTGPCKHMIARHGPECSVIVKQDSEYGMIYESCNCYQDDGEWVYEN